MNDRDNQPWTWRYEAKCQGEDTEIFFPPRDKELYKIIADKAKAICNGKDGRPACPVKQECLKEAIVSEELHGIFGGMSHRERNALKRKYEKQGLTLDEWLDKNNVKAPISKEQRS